MPKTPMPPLHNIRVLDLSRVVAGPLCSMMLADLGATVIKVEPPGHGDDSRLQPPMAAGESHLYLCVNRNKQSIVLDLRTEAGRKVLWDLVEACDVLLENFRPGTMARFGFDYPTVAARCPRLIYCSVSGYGQTGSQAQRGGYDPVVQAESGMMALVGDPDGQPLRHPVPINDITTAHYATQAILAALLARHTTSQGQHIDLALYDVAVATVLNFNQYYLVAEEMPPRLGNEHPTAVPLALFDTQTGPFYLAAANDRLFRALCDQVVQRPDLAEDARFATNATRVANRETLMAELRAIFAGDTREVWLQKLLAAGLPAGAVRTVAENVHSPEIQERGLLAHLPHPTAETVRLVNSPLRLSATPVVTPVAPPTLGQHTDDVLGTVLGYDAAKIAQLRQDKVVE